MFFDVGRPTDLDYVVRRPCRLGAAERTDLHGGDHRARLRPDLGLELGLKDGTPETETAAIVDRRPADRSDVGGPEPYRKSWRVLGRLVGMRQENDDRHRILPVLRSDQGPQRLGVEARRVGAETLFLQKGAPAVPAERLSTGSDFLRPRSAARGFDQPHGGRRRAQSTASRWR